MGFLGIFLRRSVIFCVPRFHIQCKLFFLLVRLCSDDFCFRQIIVEWCFQLLHTAFIISSIIWKILLKCLVRLGFCAHRKVSHYFLRTLIWIPTWEENNMALLDCKYRSHSHNSKWAHRPNIFAYICENTHNYPLCTVTKCVCKFAHFTTAWCFRHVGQISLKKKKPSIKVAFYCHTNEYIYLSLQFTQNQGSLISKIIKRKMICIIAQILVKVYVEHKHWHTSTWIARCIFI